ncbi:MAG TPA: molybdopterin converting factor subunit 1 [Burkholderiaceae bacterium]|nr:molybdopterin converting factor subunit 1 [Burkholderiaceae bacterium]
MNIQLRFFAGIRETLGHAGEAVSLPDYVDTVGAVRQILIERGGVWATALSERRALRMAYNQEMADPQTRIAEGGEVAFFPPVTGG